MPKRIKPPGSGRKLGSGRFGEPTEATRVPVSVLPLVKEFVWAMLRLRKANKFDPDQIKQMLQNLDNPA